MTDAESLPCELVLSSGHVVLLDPEDLPLLSGFIWRAEERRHTSYVRAMRTVIPGRGGKRVPVYLHRLIVGAGPGEVVDHINHDGLDNRRCNLRLCSQQQNAQHQRRSHSFKGTKWNSRLSKWQARIVVPCDGRPRGKELYLGIFSAREDAARAYDRAALEHFGPFAVLNYPLAPIDGDPSRACPELYAEPDARMGGAS